MKHLEGFKRKHLKVALGCLSFDRHMTNEERNPKNKNWDKPSWLTNLANIFLVLFIILLNVLSRQRENFLVITNFKTFSLVVYPNTFSELWVSHKSSKRAKSNYIRRETVTTLSFWHMVGSLFHTWISSTCENGAICLAISP